MSNEFVIDFDSLEPKTIPVKLGGKWYILQEASGDATVRYRNANSRAAKMVDGKVVGVENIADSEPQLVRDCLFEGEPGNNPPHTLTIKIVNKYPVVAFTLAQVRSWPNRIMSKLFDTIQEISPGLIEETRTVLEKRLADTQKRLAALDESKSNNSNGSSEGSKPSPTDTHAEEMAKN